MITSRRVASKRKHREMGMATMEVAYYVTRMERNIDAAILGLPEDVRAVMRRQTLNNLPKAQGNPNEVNNDWQTAKMEVFISHEQLAEGKQTGDVNHNYRTTGAMEISEKAASASETRENKGFYGHVGPNLANDIHWEMTQNGMPA